ncbi:uncharacterized protein LOC117338468 [Pecten maximus]|uniref:uncharacterized protein LOC117338468 n=1 Tax=Pecten maximus TaxID=6579 RepID=UPI001458FFB1|nr:uncharacterized protein LOC117338468 [Pecten maximus]
MSDQGELYEDSWILYHVLDMMVGSREMVAVRRKLTLVREQITNSDKTKLEIIFTGSSAEGIHMKDSDEDQMLIDNSVVVICPNQQTSITPDIEHKTVFIMGDTNSRPGYVTLQLIGRRCTPDLLNSIVPVGNVSFVSSEMYARQLSDQLSDVFRITVDPHGPATATPSKLTHLQSDMDFVRALKCTSWPSEANEWLSRHRLYNWPNTCLRDQIVQGGCHLVPVGDKTSADTFLQWRISFATAERKLIHSLSHVQFQVYCLLKYLLKQISGKLKQIYGDTDILSSYIIKTTILHAVENTPLSLWEEKNTFLCFMLCLDILATWVKSGYCPNYFIKRNNMFLGKVHGEHQQNLLRLLVELRDMTWGCLSIGTFFQPSIGETIQRVKNGAWELALPTPVRSERGIDFTMFEKSCILFRATDVLPALKLLSKSKSDMDECVAYLNTVSALSLKGREAYEKQAPLEGNKQRYKYLRKCKKFISPLAVTCTSPGLLTLATYHYQTGNYMKTLEMCGHLISSWKFFIGNNSEKEGDRYEHLYCGRGYSLLHKFQQAWASYMFLQRKSPNFCPVHLQQELTKVPYASLLIPPLPYAVFLTFLCYHELNDTRRRDAALKDLRAVKYDKDQGGSKHWIVHNLLGICYEMVGDIHRALREYNDSLGDDKYLHFNNPAMERIERL